MNYVENIYICLAAPILVAIFLSANRGRAALIFILSGMTACLFSSYISTFAAGLAGVEMTRASFEIAPVVEEVMKFLPILFYLLVFNAEQKSTIMGTLLVAVGFATFENVCFLTSYGSGDLLRLVIRGFGTGAMHVMCGMVVSVGLFLLWGRARLRAAGVFALLCFVIRFHAIFNLLVNQSGAVFWVGSLIPLTFMLLWFLFFRRKIEFS